MWYHRAKLEYKGKSACRHIIGEGRSIHNPRYRTKSLWYSPPRRIPWYQTQCEIFYSHYLYGVESNACAWSLSCTGRCSCIVSCKSIKPEYQFRCYLWGFGLTPYFTGRIINGLNGESLKAWAELVEVRDGRIFMLVSTLNHYFSLSYCTTDIYVMS